MVPDLQRETLSKYKHPLVKAVAEYRDTQSLLSRVHTWAAGRYRDGRVYPQWNPARAATGRASCTTPNVQSLPKGGGFRGYVRPQEGRVLVKADLSQIELRVLAAITEDENMLEVFGRGGDLHLNTAEVLAGCNVKKGDLERQKAKAVNFGLSFGMGAKRFKVQGDGREGLRGPHDLVRGPRRQGEAARGLPRDRELAQARERAERSGRLRDLHPAGAPADGRA